MGCENSIIISVNSEEPVHSVEMNSNPEPKILVLEFQSKAKTLMEKTYGVLWSQLMSMDFSDLPEPV